MCLRVLLDGPRNAFRCEPLDVGVAEVAMLPSLNQLLEVALCVPADHEPVGPVRRKGRHVADDLLRDPRSDVRRQSLGARICEYLHRAAVNRHDDLAHESFGLADIARGQNKKEDAFRHFGERALAALGLHSVEQGPQWDTQRTQIVIPEQVNHSMRKLPDSIHRVRRVRAACGSH